MKHNLYLLIILLAQFNYSQELKTYKGKYNEGDATYQYYENAEYERVLNGYFEYSRKVLKETESKMYNICVETGTFIDNKKNGEWTFRTKVISEFLKLDAEILMIKGNYKNDLKTGAWAYTISSIREVGKSFQPKLEFTGKLIFLNDTIVSKLDYPAIKGEIDSKGNLIGNWYYHKLDREITASFMENILVKLLDRNISTGKINAKYIPNLDLINFKETINKFSRTNKYNTYNLKKIGGLPLYDENKNDYRFGIDESLSFLLKYYEGCTSDILDIGKNVFYGPHYKYLERKVVLKQPVILVKD